MDIHKIKKHRLNKYIYFFLVICTVLLSFNISAFEDTQRYISDSKYNGGTIHLGNEITRSNDVLCQCTSLKNNNSVISSRGMTLRSSEQKISYLMLVLPFIFNFIIRQIIWIVNRQRGNDYIQQLIVSYIHRKDGKKAHIYHFS